MAKVMKPGKVENEPVIFRKYPDGDIIALFPEISVDQIGYNCESYMHIGQHGAASPMIVIKQTKLAKPKEYKELYAELVKLGYDLKIIKRFRQTHLLERKKQARV